MQIKMSRKEKNKKMIASISLLFLFSFVFLTCPLFTRTAKAWDALPAAIAGASYKEALEVAKEIANGIALAQAKMQAVKKLTEEVENMASGSGSGEAKFITDWKKYLETDPEKKTSLYMNDYISQYFDGQGAANYVSATGEGGSDDYVREMQQALKSTYKAKNEASSLLATANQFRGIATRIQGGLTGMNKLDTTGVNPKTGTVDSVMGFVDFAMSPKKNPYLIGIQMESENAKKLEDEKEIARTMAISYQGYKGVASNGKIITPGSNVKDMISNVQNLAGLAIVNAKSVYEVVASLASEIANGAMENGIGKAKDSSQQESGSVTDKLNNQNSDNISI